MENKNEEKGKEEHPHPGHDHDKKYTIIINGRPKEVTSKELTYEEIVNLAYDNNPPTGPNVVITITYAKAEGNRQGTLLPEQSVKIKDGMVFNVKATDRS